MAERRPLSLRVLPFTAEAFVGEVRSACGAQVLGELEWVPDQVRYLASYLRNHDRPARTLIIEAPYVDRHYLEEFTGYYATALTPPSSKTTRIHVLSTVLDTDGFLGIVKKAADGGYATGYAALQAM